MLSEMPDFPSPTFAGCGITAEKSLPGFAVPDSVHQVKFAAPRKLPLRRTVTSADDSAAGTSTKSAANSIFDAPDATPADAPEATPADAPEATPADATVGGAVAAGGGAVGALCGVEGASRVVGTGVSRA